MKQSKYIIIGKQHKYSKKQNNRKKFKKKKKNL